MWHLEWGCLMKQALEESSKRKLKGNAESACQKLDMQTW